MYEIYNTILDNTQYTLLCYNILARVYITYIHICICTSMYVSKARRLWLEDLELLDLRPQLRVIQGSGIYHISIFV